jgi:hypothetical protein
MNRKYLFPIALSCVLGISRLNAAPVSGSHVPPEIAARKEAPAIQAALQPLRDKLTADRKALAAALKSGDQAAITAGKAAIAADFKAIREKRVALNKAAK